MTTVDLFKFTLGSDVWTFTSGSDPVTYLAEDYAPVPIARSRIDQKSEISKSGLSISVDIENTLAQQMLTTVNEEILSVIVFESSESGTAAIWRGRVAAIQPEGQRLAFACESIFTSLRQPGLRAHYLRICRHALYSPNCGVDKADFEESGTATAHASGGRILTVSGLGAFADAYFTGGMILDSAGAYRWIVRHVGSTIELSRESAMVVSEIDTSASSAILLYPGCDLTRATCRDKFNNVINMGGFPWLPYKNPFDGTSIV